MIPEPRKMLKKLKILIRIHHIKLIKDYDIPFLTHHAENCGIRIRIMGKSSSQDPDKTHEFRLSLVRLNTDP